VNVADLLTEREVLVARMAALDKIAEGWREYQGLLPDSAKRSAPIGATRPCAGPGCEEPVPVGFNRRYCSPTCKHRAWLERQKNAAPDPVHHADPDAALSHDAPTVAHAVPNGEAVEPRPLA
jgi:hypothetical protein